MARVASRLLAQNTCHSPQCSQVGKTHSFKTLAAVHDWLGNGCHGKCTCRYSACGVIRHSNSHHRDLSRLQPVYFD